MQVTLYIGVLGYRDPFAFPNFSKFKIHSLMLTTISHKSLLGPISVASFTHIFLLIGHHGSHSTPMNEDQRGKHDHMITKHHLIETQRFCNSVFVDISIVWLKWKPGFQPFGLNHARHTICIYSSCLKASYSKHTGNSNHTWPLAFRLFKGSTIKRLSLECQF